MSAGEGDDKQGPLTCVAIAAGKNGCLGSGVQGGEWVRVASMNAAAERGRVFAVQNANFTSNSCKQAFHPARSPSSALTRPTRPTFQWCLRTYLSQIVLWDNYTYTQEG